MNTQDQQNQWVKQFCAGDQYAYKVFFEEYYQVLGCFAAKYVKDIAVAEDMVNDVILDFYSHKRDFENVIALKSFLYLSIKNRCLNHLRRKEARESYLNVQEQEEGSEFFLDSIIEEEVYYLLRQAVGGLPVQMRRIYELSLAGCTNEEIADQLELSIDSVKAYKKRGKQLLKDKLQGLMYMLSVTL